MHLGQGLLEEERRRAVEEQAELRQCIDEMRERMESLQTVSSLSLSLVSLSRPSRPRAATRRILSISRKTLQGVS